MIDLPQVLVSEDFKFWKLQVRLLDVEFARKQYD